MGCVKPNIFYRFYNTYNRECVMRPTIFLIQVVLHIILRTLVYIYIYMSKFLREEQDGCCCCNRIVYSPAAAVVLFIL